MSLFSTIQVYEQDGAIVFKIPADTAPFASYPKGSIRVRDYNTNGLQVEHVNENYDICFVENPDDILDATSTPYGITKAAVYTALNSFIGVSSTTITGTVATSNTILENLAELESFVEIPGNSIEVTYYTGVDTDNPSGNTNNIYTIVYKTGLTVVSTKTIAYNLSDNIIKITTT
jgi:hypothetical protein